MVIPSLIRDEKTAPSGCCCASKTPSAPTVKVVDESLGRDLTLRLQVSGATCASCVSRIENALATVAGVTQARMELASGIATVKGSVIAAPLVEALQALGYGAAVVN